MLLYFGKSRLFWNHLLPYVWTSNLDVPWLGSREFLTAEQLADYFAKCSQLLFCTFKDVSSLSLSLVLNDPQRKGSRDKGSCCWRGAWTTSKCAVKTKRPAKMRLDGIHGTEELWKEVHTYTQSHTLRKASS